MTILTKKNRDVAAFLLALLLLVATINGNNGNNATLGFVAPVNGHAVGFDLGVALFWLLFLYTARRLYLEFRKKPDVTK
jgi:hypothetical protein